MKNIPIFVVCAFAFLLMPSEASAQSHFYSPHNNYSNQGGYGYNGHSSQTGYCLKNDCFGGGGGYGQNGCSSCGGGCSSCGGSTPTVIVRVKIGGQPVASPSVQTYYPSINNGCPGCGGYYGMKQNPSTRNVAANKRIQSKAPVSARRSPVQNASYRYRF